MFQPECQLEYASQVVTANVPARVCQSECASLSVPSKMCQCECVGMGGDLGGDIAEVWQLDGLPWAGV